MRFEDTIAAIATPPGRGAIAIVRVSGSVAEVAARVAPQAALRPGHAQLCAIIDAAGKLLDRGLVLYARAPRSYTGEDTLELHVHGSPIVARDVLRAVMAAGARLAQPGEFTQRAFLNGKIDLNAAASVADLIDAETSSAARAAAANLAGGLAQHVAAIRIELARHVEDLAGAIDFPEEVGEPPREHFDAALARVQDRLEALQRDGEVGRLLREGLSVAIVGAPNAGKSSLLNALLGHERAIVSEVAGTTRDTIEESFAIDGVAVRVIDTAGIREHADRLERAGIERTHAAMQQARIVLIVIDASQPLPAQTLRVLEETADRPRVIFYNKADVGVAQPALAGAVVGTVRDAATVEALRRDIAIAGWGGERPDLERPHLATLREFDAVNEALAALHLARGIVAAGEPLDLSVGELQRAFAALGHISGDVAAEEVVHGVFARFCIGK